MSQPIAEDTRIQILDHHNPYFVGLRGTVTTMFPVCTQTCGGVESKTQACLVRLDHRDSLEIIVDVADLRPLIPGATDDKR